MLKEKQQQELRKRLLIAVLIPVGLLVVIGVVLGGQILRMTDDMRWLDHSTTVLAKTHDFQKQVIDQETGLRGYLLTDDVIFLEPYTRARPVEALNELQALVADSASQTAKIDELRSLYDRWRKSTEGVTAQAVPPIMRTRQEMAARKIHMDALRETLRAFLEAERTLRQARAETSERSRKTTELLFVLVFLGTAAVLGFVSRRQMGSIVATYATALDGERAARVEMEDEAWRRAGQMRVANAGQGDLSLEELGGRVLRELAAHVKADVGALFTHEGRAWRRRAALGLDAAGASETFATGEGLVGKAAEGKSVVAINDVPSGYLKIRGGTGESTPASLFVVPASVEGTTHAVIELGFLRNAEPRTAPLLERIGESIALAVRSAEYKARLRELLEESQRQAEELQTQQEELRVANEELEEQSNAVREAQAKLEERQEELEAANARLEEQTLDLTTAQKRSTEHATEMARASRYKSEFLANMSHELRTPLNSSLILAKLLADNKHGNLTAEQVKFAETIYSAGNDLLNLIGDILDLSKIEAGKVDIAVAAVPMKRIADALKRTFDPIALDKKVDFAIRIGSGVPATLDTDAQRVDQVLKNLLSNAFKFTERGAVTVDVTSDGRAVHFVVKDTGVGIPDDQQEMIFEAFRQADGTTNRKFGGTGLGLSISRDLARLLGGDIAVESKVGQGSTFTFWLPRTAPKAQPVRTALPPLASKSAPSDAPPPNRSIVPSAAFDDDRARIDPKQRLVLIVEDDVPFAKILLDLAHELEFQGIVAHEADHGLALAIKHVPSAIVLDVNLPDRSGLSVLDRLKRTPQTRHIPVHVVSATDVTQTALSMGAIGYLRKPASRDDLTTAFRTIEQRLERGVRHLLIVEDDAVQRDSLTKLLGGSGVLVTAVGTVEEALAALAKGTFDCVVTDLALPDASGFELVERMGASDAYAFPPIIVYTGRSLTAEEEQRLRMHSNSIIVKGARSPERLLDEVTLFLHQVEADLPPERQRMLRVARDRESIFDGRRVLVVEDDVRNIFALSSVLEPRGAKVLIARNGREGIEMLEKNPDIDVVLMDIMMPEMDGLTAMRHIRKAGRWAKLPIIALTAKAMKDDQERCLQAGANDYIAKPLDVEMLLSLLRVWMPK